MPQRRRRISLGAGAGAGGGALDPFWPGLGFRHTSDFAYRPLADPPLDFRPVPGVHIRRALLDDQEALIDLFEELVTYHVANDPGVRPACIPWCCATSSG